MRPRARPFLDDTFLPPFLFRFLEQRYVDSFFSTGSLYLTSYRRCRTHEDAVRLDADEGKYTFHFQGRENNLFLRRDAGNNSYMLCTSFSSSPELKSHFGVNSCFRIDNPLRFIRAIEKSLDGVAETTARAVLYVWNRAARRSFEDSEFMHRIKPLLDHVQGIKRGNLEQIWNEVHEEHARRLDGFMTGIEYYTKPLSYVREVEFRIVWTTATPTENGMIIECPEAVRYYSRMDA